MSHPSDKEKTVEQRVFDNFMKFKRTGGLETRADYEHADFKMLVVEPLSKMTWEKFDKQRHDAFNYIEAIVDEIGRVLGVSDYLIVTRLTKCILLTKPFWYGDYNARKVSEGYIQRLVFDLLNGYYPKRKNNDADNTETSSTKDRPFYNGTL